MVAQRDGVRRCCAALRLSPSLPRRWRLQRQPDGGRGCHSRRHSRRRNRRCCVSRDNEGGSDILPTPPHLSPQCHCCCLAPSPPPPLPPPSPPYAATATNVTTIHPHTSLTFVSFSMILIIVCGNNHYQQVCPLALNCVGRLFFSNPTLNEIRAKFQKHRRPKGQI
jgi:hypothetical protein